MGQDDPVTSRLEQARASVAREMAELADRLEEELRGYDSPDLKEARRLLVRLEEMVGELGGRIDSQLQSTLDSKLEALGDRLERRLDESDDRVATTLNGHVGRLEGALHSIVESFTKAVHPFSRGEEAAELGVEGEKREREFTGRVRDAEQRLNTVLHRITSVEERMNGL